MKNLFKLLEEPLVFLKGSIIFIIGASDERLAYLALAMVLDCCLAVSVAIKNKEFKFSILYRKFFSKSLVYLLWIAMFHAFDKVAGLPDTARWSVILILTGLEVMSALKNTSQLGYTDLADQLGRIYVSLTKGKGGSTNESKPVPKRKPRAKKPAGTTQHEDKPE